MSMLPDGYGDGGHWWCRHCEEPSATDSFVLLSLRVVMAIEERMICLSIW